MYKNDVLIDLKEELSVDFHILNVNFIERMCMQYITIILNLSET